MEITLKIRRYNPETDAAPHYQEYTLQSIPTRACWTPSWRSTAFRTAARGSARAAPTGCAVRTPCENHFKCTRSCPRGILITKRINQTKRVIDAQRQEDDPATE